MTDKTTKEYDTWSLLIPDFSLRSLNSTQDRHWSHRHKRKQKTIETLSTYCIQSGGIPEFSGFVTVKITRLWGKRQRALDEENLWGGVKIIRDAMRRRKLSGKGWAGGLGIIEDDGPDQCKMRVDQERNSGPCKDRECLLIEVTGKRVK